MVKKNKNPLNIDFKKCVVEDCLLQVRDVTNIDKPELINVWTVEVNPRDSKEVIKFIKSNTQGNDPISFNHVKRIKKDVENNVLIVIICSCEFIEGDEEFLELIDKASFQYENISRRSRIPRIGPSTKELCVEWSTEYWPLVWRGNPNDQILNDYVFDMDFIREVLGKISHISREEAKKGKLPIVTAFSNPLDQEVIISLDHRDEGTVLDHSVMCGIREVAKREQERRDGIAQGKIDGKDRPETYLCLDFEIYTTHEPCSMCAMALIHSRVKRCIFLRPMDETGCLKPSSGDKYCMHSNRELNSKYEVFQWIGDGFTVPDVDHKTCC